MNAIIPIPQRTVAIRVATMADLPFLDALQKKHSKQLGYFPTKQFEGYIGMGAVLVAEERHEGTEARRHEGVEEQGKRDQVNSLVPSPPRPSLRASVPSCLRASPPASPLGYIISRDRYLKRDELGVIYQLCVAPGEQRKLIGATLVKEVFARSAYGCRLYCCWCAQDLEANRFWESLGFVPIAFRAGSALRRRSGQGRVHIFWQRRVEREEVSAYRSVGVSESSSAHAVTPTPSHPVTPYWYPFQTNGGAIREDRLVFPIPPGVHWKDVEAVAVPTATDGEVKELAEPKARKRKTKVVPPPSTKLALGAAGGLRFAAPAAPAASVAPKAQRPRVEKARVSVDPKLRAAARELRDRWMERVNGGGSPLAAGGKYDVSRTLPAMSAVESPAMSAVESPAMSAVESPAMSAVESPAMSAAPRVLPDAA